MRTPTALTGIRVERKLGDISGVQTLVGEHILEQHLSIRHGIHFAAAVAVRLAKS